MIVCISDLHLKEEQSHRIQTAEGEIGLQRNVDAKSMQRFFEDIGKRVKTESPQQVDIVLAGDIFELNRSSMWFAKEGDGGQKVRPYVANREIVPGDDVELRALKILDAIAADPNAGPCLKTIAQAPRWIFEAAETDSVPVHVHYLPGNHDRLGNATPTIRQKVRDLLGIKGEDKHFAHSFRNPNRECPELVVRHGHEYDRYNFGADFSQHDRLPAVFDSDDYGAPCFGDAVTLDVAMRLPYLFRKRYEDAIVQDFNGVHRSMYLHLLQFDDLRPQSALVDYLLAMPGVDPEDNWNILRPVVVDLLEEIRENEFFKTEIKRLNAKVLDAFNIGAWLLKYRGWRWGLSYKALRFIADRLWAKGGNGPTVAQMAAKERLLQEDAVRFVIAGHTHAPDIQLLGNGRYGGRYYLDTGTWRDRVLSGHKRQAFGTVRTATHVMVCGKAGRVESEDLAGIEMWTGYSRRWDEAAVQKDEVNAKRAMLSPQRF